MTDYKLTANDLKIMYGNRTKEEQKKLPHNKIRILETMDITIKQLNRLLDGANKLDELIGRIEKRPKSGIEKVALEEYSIILQNVRELIYGYIQYIYKNLIELNNQLWKKNNVKNIFESKKLIEYIINKLNTEFKEKLMGNPSKELSKSLPKNLPRNTKVYELLLLNIGGISLYEQLVIFFKKIYKKVIVTKTKQNTNNTFRNRFLKRVKNEISKNKKDDDSKFVSKFYSDSKAVSKFYSEGIDIFKEIIYIYKNDIKVLIPKIFSFYVSLGYAK